MAPEVTVIHVAVLDADHAQPDVVDTPTCVPAPPAEPMDWFVGLIEKEHVVPAWFTVTTWSPIKRLPTRATLVAELHGHRKRDDSLLGITSAAVSPDGRRFATASVAGDAWVWDARTGAPHAHLDDDDGEIRDIMFGPDATTICSATKARTC